MTRKAKKSNNKIVKNGKTPGTMVQKIKRMKGLLNLTFEIFILFSTFLNLLAIIGIAGRKEGFCAVEELKSL